METLKSKKQESGKNIPQRSIILKSSNIPRLSTLSVIHGTEKRSVSLSPSIPVAKKKEKPPAESAKPALDNKIVCNNSMQIGPIETNSDFDYFTHIPIRDRTKCFSRGKFQDKKKKNREYLSFKSKFNNSAGNILKNWMKMMYCVLMLRMNLIKYIIEQFPQSGGTEFHLHKQILLESKVIYNMVKNAQNFSQEQFLFVWNEVERLINNYLILKNALYYKKRTLLKMQNQVSKLKITQDETMKEYFNKIQALKTQIEEKEAQIKVEKEEKRKIKTDLAEWFENHPEK